MIDSESAKDLNLIHGSPKFALKIEPTNVVTLIQPSEIPDDDCMYVVAGQSVLPNETVIPSVFTIEQGGGNLVKVYWRISDHWYEPSDEEVTGLLGDDQSGLFPFDWTYSIPVENDIYHS